MHSEIPDAMRWHIRRIRYRLDGLFDRLDSIEDSLSIFEAKALNDSETKEIDKLIVEITEHENNLSHLIDEISNLFREQTKGMNINTIAFGLLDIFKDDIRNLKDQVAFYADELPLKKAGLDENSLRGVEELRHSFEMLDFIIQNCEIMFNYSLGIQGRFGKSATCNPDKSTIDIPISLHSSIEEWCILGHEIGHVLFHRLLQDDKLTEITDYLRRNLNPDSKSDDNKTVYWFEELFCDCVMARLFNEAAVTAIDLEHVLEREYGPYYTEEHPPGSLRSLIVYRYLTLLHHGQDEPEISKQMTRLIEPSLANYWSLPENHDWISNQIHNIIEDLMAENPPDSAIKVIEILRSMWFIVSGIQEEGLQQKSDEEAIHLLGKQLANMIHET